MIKVVQIGCGKMSKYIMRYIYEKKGSVIKAFDVNSDIIGKDIGSIMETHDVGITVEDISNLDNSLKDCEPDIAIITTMSFLNDLEKVIRICVKNGVNVITTCEEAFYPINSNYKLYEKLDTLAKAYNVSILGTGYQDIFWNKLVLNICASTNRITKIKGLSSYNVEDYGIALAKAHGAGLSIDEFNKEFGKVLSEDEIKSLMEDKSFYPSYMWNVVGSLVDKLGLTLTSIKEEHIPVVCEEKINSSTLNMDLEKGMVRGMNAVVIASTKEHIEIEVECIGKVYTDDEKDINSWTIYGEPTTSLVNESPCTVELTCADVVNRIPDVIEAKSGFITNNDLKEASFKFKI